MQPKLSILICSLNVLDHLERCFVSLYGQEQGVDFEVILVDNDSNDGTVDHVKARWPQVRIVANRANVGFAQANNQALALATGTYVLFLNPDTEVGPGTLRRCVETLDDDTTIGMVGCQLRYPDGQIQYECARSAYRLGDLFIEAPYLHRFFPSHPLFGRQILGHWDHKDSRDVEGISGAFMMLRRDLANRLGGMATEVFLYHEDMDLSLRVRQSGYRIRYLADVYTIHHMSRSTLGRWADPNWSLLELETNIRLIRQIQGRPAAAVARVAYLLRSIGRLGLATVGKALPAERGIRARFPTAFSIRRHALQAAWSISPGLVAHRLPHAPRLDEVAPPAIHEPAEPVRSGRVADRATTDRPAD